MRNTLFLLLCTLLLSSSGSVVQGCTSESDLRDTIRFASYNVSMYREGETGLRDELKGEISEQVLRVTSVIQRVRPDVLALMEFDYDPSGESIDLFRSRCLSSGKYGAEPITYPYAYQVPSNTGVLSGQDLDNDGRIQLPADAFGFGRHPGQYGFALLSMFPLVEDEIRSFQSFLWHMMPEPNWPVQQDGSSYYTDSAKAVFRISSKNHIDLPLRVNNAVIHVVLAHPTPPVFDGPEDRNGLRNLDEIRLIKDYVEGASYLVDDQGESGGLPDNASFVVMGDLNADPYQGDSAEGAIGQLLKSDRVNHDVAFGHLIPSSPGGAAMPRREGYAGQLRHNTSMFSMRIDYVLPSADLSVVASGVFWPGPGDPALDLVKDRAASDHLLVWVDVVVGEGE